MPDRPCRSPDLFLILSAVFAPPVAFATMALMPPVQGAMLLVPVRAGASPVRAAFAAAIPVLGRGPGSTVVVYGRRAAVFAPMIRAGLIPLAAPAILCGGVR